MCAKAKWNRDFNDNAVRKDQVEVLNPNTGLPTGSLVPFFAKQYGHEPCANTLVICN